MLQHPVPTPLMPMAAGSVVQAFAWQPIGAAATPTGVSDGAAPFAASGASWLTDGAPMWGPDDKWTPQADERLREVVAQFQGKQWKKIAAVAFGNAKSDVQCLHRWAKVLRPGIVKGPWTPEEDELMRGLVAQHGLKKWSVIAQHIPGRLGKQCRERWFNHVDPAISHAEWTPEEDEILAAAHAKLGNAWAAIAKQLPGRTENSVKNYFNSTLSRNAMPRVKLNQTAAPAAASILSTPAMDAAAVPAPLARSVSAADPAVSSSQSSAAHPFTNLLSTLPPALVGVSDPSHSDLTGGGSMNDAGSSAALSAAEAAPIAPLRGMLHTPLRRRPGRCNSAAAFASLHARGSAASAASSAAVQPSTAAVSALSADPPSSEWPTALDSSDCAPEPYLSQTWLASVVDAVAAVRTKTVLEAPRTPVKPRASPQFGGGAPSPPSFPTGASAASAALQLSPSVRGLHSGGGGLSTADKRATVSSFLASPFRSSAEELRGGGAEARSLKRASASLTSSPHSPARDIRVAPFHASPSSSSSGSPAKRARVGHAAAAVSPFSCVCGAALPQQPFTPASSMQQLSLLSPTSCRACAADERSGGDINAASTTPTIRRPRSLHQSFTSAATPTTFPAAHSFESQSVAFAAVDSASSVEPVCMDSGANGAAPTLAASAFPPPLDMERDPLCRLAQDHLRWADAHQRATIARVQQQQQAALRTRLQAEAQAYPIPRRRVTASARLAAAFQFQAAPTPS